MATPTRSKGGRAPDPATDAAILDAAKDLLAEVGFHRMSIQAITDRTGIAKTTIYRRYPDKTTLAAAAINRLADTWDQDTGDARADLVATLEHLRLRVDTALVGTLLSEEPHHPELLARFRELVTHPRLGHIQQTRRRGIERGEVRADLDVLLAAEAVAGSFFAHYLNRGRPGDGWAEELVATLWPAVAA
jgi:AcrR family transcriptional regulator